MEIINGSNAQTEIVTLACKEKPGQTAGDYSVNLSHGGQTFTLKAGQAVRVPRVRAAFFLAKSDRWDINNPLMLEIVKDTPQASGNDDERDSLIDKVIELGLASGRREAKKLTTEELKALVSQAG
jgi:hypothetical protein